MQFFTFLVLVSLLPPSTFVSGAAIHTTRASAPSVSISLGTIVGTTNALAGVDSFRGIPFAEAPVGDLRFAPPVARTASLGTFDATEWGYSCPQMNLLDQALPGVLDTLGEEALNLVESLPLFTTISGSNTSEDCLNINVFRPSGISSTAKLPVMFWIFGGAFLLGSPTMYDGTSLVQRSVSLGTPIIFVSVNYRLNGYGFMPGQEIADDATASVNAGLYDQRMGLEWVQTNIGAFGGDPTKVTMFGESAGAISVSFQLLAFNGVHSGLFRGAIMESGSPIPVGPASRGQNSFDTVAKATGCSSASDKVACLRAVDADTLTAAINLLPNILSYHSVSLAFLPRTDGVFLTDVAQTLLSEGSYAKDVSIISGDQYDEGTILALGTLNITTTAQLDAWLAADWFPNTTAAQRTQLLSLYPEDPTQGSPFDTGLLSAVTAQNKRINAIVGDAVFQVPRRIFNSVTSATQPTWSYVSRVYQFVPLLGSFHASDILSVFGLNPLAPTTEIQSRWIAFANTLNPNVKGYTYWPEYGTNATLLQFSDVTSSSLIFDTFRQAAMAYWTEIISYLVL